MFNFVAEPSAVGSLRAVATQALVWLFSAPDAAPVGSQIGSKRQTQVAPQTGPALARMSAADQWARVSGVLTRSDGQAKQARELQGRASQQIDLATYAFNSIIDELSAVMALPARRESAVLQLFEPALARAQARGAVAAYRAA